MGENALICFGPSLGSTVDPEVMLVPLDLPSFPSAKLSAAGLPEPLPDAGCSKLGSDLRAGNRFLRDGPDRGWKPELPGAKAGWLAVPSSVSRSCTFFTPDCRVAH